MQVYQTDRCYNCNDKTSENKYEIKLISPDFDSNNRPIQLDEYLHQCCKCGRCWCGRNIFKYSDNDRNRFDENSKIDIEKK